MDVGQHSTRGDGDLAKQLAQLFIIANSQLDVPGNDPGLLVVTGCIASKLQDLSREVFQYCCQVDWGASSNSGSILALLKVASDTPDRELQGADGLQLRSLSRCQVLLNGVLQEHGSLRGRTSGLFVWCLPA